MRSSTSKEREGEKERKGNKGREKKGEKGKGKGLREEKVNFFSEQKFWL